MFFTFITLALAVLATGEKTIAIISDYGLRDDVLAQAANTFDGLSQKLGEGGFDVSLILTPGDINQINKDSLTTEEWQSIMDLFDRDNVRGIPIYPCLGNHDWHFPWTDV